MGTTVRLTFQKAKNGLAYLRGVEEEKRVSYVVTSRELVRQVPRKQRVPCPLLFLGSTPIPLYDSIK